MIKKFIAKLLGIYTFSDFYNSLDENSITLTQLSVLKKLQSKAHFDYSKKQVVMTKELVDEYKFLLGRSLGNGYGFVYFDGFEVKEIPNIK